LIDQTPGLGLKFKNVLSERFELGYFLQNRPQELLTQYQEENHTPLEKPINVLLSQINSVNHQRPELHRLNVIRLYLIKSYKGRCHALGKPVRGQRTWSNA
jgi:ribosomal protein S13